MVTLLSSVLDILYPPQPQRALNFLAVAAVDIHSTFQLECWQTLNWYDRWWFEVAGPPCMLLALVAVRWAWARRGPEDLAKAAAEAQAAAFFVVMLLYPRVSSRIFAVPRCRWLGPESEGPSVLEAA